jgi:Ca2+-transporting ATPase
VSEIAWHAQAIDDALRRLDSTRAGLSEDESARRLAAVGPNRLGRARPVTAVRILARQLTTVVVLLLAGAALVALSLGDHIEAAAIAAVLLLNTAIGFVTELRARRAMHALLQLEVPRAIVVRAGRSGVVDAAELVPGDVIELAAGQAVPADGRLVSAIELRTTEASLTGESLPVSKQADTTLAADTSLAERFNMIYSGTSVAAGTGRALVTATGGATELGRIGALVAAVSEERTPLERRLDVLGRRLVWLTLGIAVVVAGLEAMHGSPAGLVIETGIALAVAAVPEALPAVVTIALAIGLRRMARRNALVRRLPSVEALGSTTVICTDKTRTLTSGDMSVVRLWTAGAELDLIEEREAADKDERFRALIAVAAQASREQASNAAGGGSTGRDPVDAAILRAAEDFGVAANDGTAARQIVGLVPFSSGRKLMAVFERTGESIVAYVKGAPARLIDASDRTLTATGETRIDAAAREQLREVNHRLAGEGLRVLAVASGQVVSADESALRGLTLAGFLGFMDPPAPDVKATIARLRRAGLRTLMLTGDQRLTAAAVGRELGLLSRDDQVLDEKDLKRLSDVDRSRRLADAAAISRVTPEDKLTIVRELQARGEIVAMLGDGVNDAAALKQADVGVAMGVRGTDVAKEAADIVLRDDRFETIAAAVEEGRVIYDNVRKFVFYLFSCNLAEILVMLVAGLANLPTPLRPLQILWINLVTDTLPALSLAMEPADPDVMRRAPRSPQEAILSRRFLRDISLYGGLITASTLAAFLWALADSPAHAATVSFMTLALAQIFHLGNARSDQPSLAPSRAFANRFAIGAVVVSAILQLAPALFAPLGALLHVTPLGLREWLVVLALASATAIAGQLLRAISARRDPPVPEAGGPP